MSAEEESVRASVTEISGAVDEFTDGLPELQKKTFDAVYGDIKDLSVDTEGYIKPTIENIKTISRVKSKLNALTDNPFFQDKVRSIDAMLERVATIQNSYYKSTFKDFTVPKVVPKIQALAFDNAVDDLLGAGIQSTVLDFAGDIVENNIRDGSSFGTMVDHLRTSLLGSKKVDSRLISYSKQIVNDVLSGFSRNYNQIVTSDLGLEWYMYIGALVDSSRPVCIVASAKKWFHVSELPALASGIIDGVQISTAGMMPGTNGSNIISRCGGYNCSHQLMGVPEEVVPQEIRDAFLAASKKD